VDGRSPVEVAEQFGYKVSALRSMVCRFRAARRRDLAPPFFSPTGGDVPRGDVVARTGMAPNCPRSLTAGN
jgi:hypothetical protein